MNILVTGANGFIGGQLIHAIHSRHKIFAVVRQLPDKNHFLGTNWIKQDLTQPLDYSRLPKHVDAIIHLAQSRFYKKFPEKSKDIFDVNINSTFQLLEYAQKVGARYFIFASSGGVYGYSYERFVETDPVSPLDFYLSSKYTSELLIANYKKFFNTVVLRLFFVYGEGQKNMLFPRLLEKIKKGETVTIEGNNGLNINPIYVGDAIRAFERALSSSSDVYNIAGDDKINIKKLVHLMCKLMGKEVQIENTQQCNIGDVLGDNTRMKQILGIYPEVSLNEGLSKMINYES